MQPIVTIEIAPSFDQGLTLTLFRKAGETGEHDAYSMELNIDNMPVVPVDRADAAEVIALVKTITICPLADWTCGLDGTTIRLTIEHGISKAQFEWWCDLPSQWEPFRDLFAAMEKLMRKTYPNYDLRLSPEDKE